MPCSVDGEGLTKEQILDRTRASLDWMFNDIKKAQKQKANMGAFILTFLAIDCFAQRRVGYTEESRGATKDGKKIKAGDSFNIFVETYLPKIRLEYRELIDHKPYDLRSRLVHRYARTKTPSIQIVRKKPKDHLTYRNELLILHIKCFAKDARAAIERYLEDLEDDQELFKLYKSAYDDSPLVGPPR